MGNLIYLYTLLLSFSIVLLLTPAVRWVAIKGRILDRPSTPVKTHQAPTPYLGGLALFIGIITSLLIIRFMTHFPTGTLHSLRAILIGGSFMVMVGLLDDLKADGLSFQWKFLFQFMAAFMLLWFDIRIKFIEPYWLAATLTVIWVVGITNAFNLIDIMDGLSSSQALIASLGFLLISLPTEKIYVNFAAASVAGACLAFLPYNMSKSFKIFMGDTGSLLLGFFMAALSLGTSYTRVSEIGLFAPLFILGLPLYDTFFVSLLRIKQGKSPFLGSKDHLALKLRALGYPAKKVVLIMGASAALCSLAAYCITWCPFYISIFISFALFLVGWYVVQKLQRVKVD